MRIAAFLAALLIAGQTLAAPVALSDLPARGTPQSTDQLPILPSGASQLQSVLFSQVESALSSYISGLGTYVTHTGAVTSGHCAEFASSLQIEDAGAPCGTVTPSTAASWTALQTFTAGAVTTPEAAPAANEVGYLLMPVEAKSASYSLAISDCGKTLLYSGSSAYTVTIPANASVAFPVGCVIDILNMGSASQSVAITSDTLDWGNSGAISTGTRTLAIGAAASLIKIGTTTWAIAGGGIS